MTTEELAKMSPEERKIAIAEVVFDALIKKDGIVLFQQPPGTEGYRGCDLSGCWIYQRKNGTFFGCNYETAQSCRTGNITEIANRNDYSGSLDAMAAAEETLLIGSPRWDAFCSALEKVCGTMNWRELIHASAAQRCDAFLLSQP